MEKIAPFKSEAQRRLFYAKENRGDLPKGTTARWEAHTPDKKLPEHVKKAEAAFIDELSRISGRE